MSKSRKIEWHVDPDTLTPAARVAWEYRVERRGIAVHESGHAAIAFDVGLLVQSMKLTTISVGLFRRHRRVLGATTWEEESETGVAPLAVLHATLAGPVAQAEWLVKNFGRSFGSAYRDSLTQGDKRAIKRIAAMIGVSWRQERRIVRRRIDTRWVAIEEIAEVLDEEGELSGSQALRIGGRALSRVARGR